MSGLDRPVRGPGAAHHFTNARLAPCAQLHPILKQHPQQLATLDLQAILKLCVLEPVRLLAVEPLDDPLKPLPRAGKDIDLAGQATPALKIPCTTPIRQEFIRECVSPTRTGAEIGGHVATSVV